MSARPTPWALALFVSWIAVLPSPGQEQAPAVAAQHVARGDACVRAGQIDQALDEFSEAIRLDPRQAAYYHRRGLLYKLTGSFVRAEDDFSALIRLMPMSAEAYYLRGTCYPHGAQPSIWEKGDPWKVATILPGHTRAIADLTEAIRLDPKMAKAYFARAGEYELTKRDYAKSIADMDAAIKLSPPGPIVAYYYWSRGYTHALFANDQQKAIADYEQALRLNPKMPVGYASRAAAYQKLGKLRQALDDYTTAIILDPQYGFAYLQRADVHAQLGDAARAESDRAKGRTLPQAPFAMPSSLR